MSSSYDKVKRAKLSFKGNLDPSKKIEKKKKKQQRQQREAAPLDTLQDEAEKADGAGQNKDSFELDSGIGHAPDGAGQNKDSFELDSGIGHAPDGGSKSKHYEELFPVETKRFGYHTEKTLTREEALDVRVKQKADRYCK